MVIGNPPYNNDIYMEFVESGWGVSDKFTIMITPAKWQTHGGARPEAFRKNVVKYMRYVGYYPDCLDIFGITVICGVSYFLLDKCNESSSSGCIVLNKSKLQPKVNSVVIRDISNGQTLWNCGDRIVQKLRMCKIYDFGEVTDRKKYVVNINKQLSNALAMYAWDFKLGRLKEECIGSGGCLFSRNGNTSVLGRSTILESTESVKSGTSMDIFTSDSIDECKSFTSWIYTKFVRFLIMINIGPLTVMNKQGWRFVPDPGSFDHIFADTELYEKYGLDENDIDIIESTIKNIKYNKHD